MAYCPDCGTEVSSGASFCEDCGADLSSDTPESHEPAQEATTPDSTEGINYKNVAAAIVLALLPAFGAYMAISLASNEAFVWVFVVAIPVFGYLLYQRPTIKAMLGGMCFWLAIESFLTPLVMLVYTFAFASQEATGAAEQAGAAIGGTILVVAAFVVGLPVGLVLYLLSRRLDVDDDQASVSGGNPQTAG